ncbi:PssD/Cps14F family polysaccharide biosynthesis glycosyltransferase [Terribacillus saccharophilus]|uniref:PssD/Cps14F family polysaccharide biosynthesis glycosyltransferase n=1 Tax=Terribacillus saccharophilus TaxID=361277 RepID=UPI003822114C
MSQLKELLNIVKEDDFYFVTEKNDTTIGLKEKYKVRFLKQQNRKSYSFIPVFFHNIFLSIKFFLIERPDLIISTGAGASIPTFILGKIFKSKLIFIESIAKVDTPTITGRIVYLFADSFYIQSKKLVKYYPKGKFEGTIY